MGGRARTLVALALAACLCALSSAPAANASLLVPNLNWTALLPPAPSPNQPQPGPIPNCKRASIACIDTEISRMTALRDRLGCDHRAIFATTYLELTKTLRSTLDRLPGLFRDPSYLYTEDAQFANVYFDTFDAWISGAAVAPAWRIAFAAARSPGVTGAQDMLLGINAHVQNDMPFVLASLGLRTPNGASRKHDHDAFNEVLNRAYESVVGEIRRRYDPLVGITNPAVVPADNIAGLEMVRGWRELVWRNAERLANVRTASQRRLVAGQIEANAAAWATLIATPRVPGATQERDRFCAAHLGH